MNGESQKSYIIICYASDRVKVNFTFYFKGKEHPLIA